MALEVSIGLDSASRSERSRLSGRQAATLVVNRASANPLSASAVPLEAHADLGWPAPACEDGPTVGEGIRKAGMKTLLSLHPSLVQGIMLGGPHRGGSVAGEGFSQPPMTGFTET